MHYNDISMTYPGFMTLLCTNKTFVFANIDARQENYISVCQHHISIKYTMCVILLY